MHKKVIVACLVNGGKQELREFGTTTSEIKTLANWLTESGCEMIAMESTGVFWKPLYNLFELMDLDAMIVNAAHMKALPGRKTDVKDAEWIADLLRHGLLKASYIPNREQRELREITRYRKSLTEERCREVNRLQKILEGANIKLDSVVKDITGKTILTQCAKSAKTVKSSYFFAQYQRISARRGKNRATLAGAHSMLIAIYHILKNKTAFHDLGSDYYDSFNRDRKINSYLKRLKALGWEPDAIPSSA